MDRMELLRMHDGASQRLFNLCELARIAPLALGSVGASTEEVDSWIFKQIQKLNDSPHGNTPITSLLNRLYTSEASHERLKMNYRKIKDAVIRNTVEHDGCSDGKLEFLQKCGLDVDDLPMIGVTVTATVTGSVPQLHEDRSSQQSFADEWIRDNTDCFDLNSDPDLSVEVDYL